jgi:arylsulfatase A-like enzyme
LASDYQRNGSFSEIAHTQFTDISAEQLVVSYRTDEWKYIINRQRDRTELYDLNTDPEETENLASSKPQIESELHNYIETHINKHIKNMGPRHDDVNPDIEERLSDLGYM